MKKTWNKPELEQLKVAATKQGVSASNDHDATTYDANGTWWGGGYTKS